MDWGISATSVGRLQQAKAPFGLLVVILYLHALCGPISRSADLVEFFAGAGHLSAQFRARGMDALTYDVSDDPDLEDMTSVIGMISAILLVLRLKIHGLLWAGIPCSSFTWLNRGTSGRSEEEIMLLWQAWCVCMEQNPCVYGPPV